MSKCISPLFLVFGIVLLAALPVKQVSSQCNPPELLPTGECADAPEICLQDACYSTQTNTPSNNHPEFCGNNTIINNPQYILFTATSTSVTININVTACNGGGCGLQAAIIEYDSHDCESWENTEVLVCDPGASVGQTMSLTTPVQMDSQYLLLIDGCNGQLCDYLIDFVQGVYTPGLSEDLSDAGSVDPVVCPGQDSWTAFASPAISGAAGYIWDGVPWPPGYVTSTLADLDIEIPTNATPGTYTICVTAFTGCDTTDTPVCFDMEVVPVDDEIASPVTLCPEEFTAGYQWIGVTVNAPGTYMQQFNNAVGCPFDSIKEFLSHPVPLVGQIDTLVCAPSFDYEGTNYTMGGSFDLIYDDQSAFGCDSMATLNLDLAYVEIETSFECDLSEFVLSAELPVLIPSGATPVYHWTTGGMFISDLEEVRVFQPGTYNLELYMIVNGETCTYAAPPIVIDLPSIVPPAPELLEADSMLCELDFPTYSVLDEDGVIDIVWTTPNGESVDGQGSNEVAIDWAGSSGGELCVHFVNDCGEGLPTCFFVTVLPEPEALFDAPSTTCTDSSVIITFSGSATSDAEYLWDFDGGTIISGGTGPGPHEISWPSTGNYDITLHVIEQGCDTSSVVGGIIVESLGAPVVNCISDVSSITFFWSPVGGAFGYSVNVLSGQPGGSIVDDTTFVITGLNPGEAVEIEVSAMSAGSCGQTVVIRECIAQSCTAPNTQLIMGPDTLCLGDVTGTYDLEGMIDGMATTGTWAGPGIIDVNAGIFDPNAAGAGVGVHQVVFTFDFGGCPFNVSKSIVIHPTPTADFNADSLMCENASVSVAYLGSATAGAQYNWDFGGGTVLSGSGQGPYEIMWSSDGIKTISLTVEQNGCLSDVFSDVVDLRPTLNKPNLTCMTSTSTISFGWSNVPNATQYQVMLLNGASGIEGPNAYDVTGLMPGDSTTIELVAMGDGTCPPTYDTLTCFAQNCPTPTITVSPDTSICMYAGTGTLDLDVQVQNGTGLGSWSGNGIIDTDAGIFDPNDAAAGPGIHVLTYTYTDQGCTFSRDVTVMLNDPPEAVISNSALTLSCDNNNELTLNGSLSTAGSNYLWTSSDGVIISGANTNMALAGAPGTYQLLVTNPSTGCKDSTAVTLVQDADVPVADAGPDYILDCNLGSVEIGGGSSTGQGITYLWSNGDTTPMITVNASGIYEIVVTDEMNGCSSRDEVAITVDTIRPVPSASVGGILDCDTDAIDITSQVVNGSGSYNYEWKTTDGAIQGSPGTADIVATSAGSYTLVVTDLENGCSDSIQVEVMADDDIISNLDFVIDMPACAGDNDGAITVVEVVGGSPPYEFSWNTGSTDSLLTDLAPGSYVLNITDQNGCGFQRTFDIPSIEVVTADLGADLLVNEGDSVTINLDTNVDDGAIASIEWSGPGSPCMMCQSLSFAAAQSGMISVTIVDTSGCTATASLVLNVNSPKNMYTPNIFTPNGDDINDRFTIYGNTISEISMMEVFDRWGELVFRTQNIPANLVDVGWDGTMGGEQLLPGVYVYRAELVHTDSTLELVSGDITLIR